MQEIPFSGQERIEGKQETEKTQIQRWAVLSAQNEYPQVIKSDNKNASAEKKLEGQFPLPHPPDIRFSPDPDSLCDSPFSVMKIGDLQNNIQMIPFGHKGGYLRPPVRNHGIMGFTDFAGRSGYYTVDIKGVGGADGQELESQRFTVRF